MAERPLKLGDFKGVDHLIM